MKTHPPIEPLEARIAPAAVAITYTDLDGDTVKITASKAGAVAPPLDDTDRTLTGGAIGHLTLLDLTEAGFDGASIVFTVTKGANGDGLADVTRIDAGGNDLGTVKLKGDLAEIDAGSGTAGTPAIAALCVRSMGLYGNGNECDIVGSLGALKVSADLRGAYLHVTGNGFTIGPVTIGGSLIGGTSLNSGRIFADGGIGAVRIGGDVQGGAGENAGSIFSGGNVGTVTIGGSLLGGSGRSSGNLFAQDLMGAVKIGASVLGGRGLSSGAIFANDDLLSLTIAGSLVGSEGGQSGGVFASSHLGPVTIGGDLRGGAGQGTGGLYTNNGKIDSVQIAGSIEGGAGLRSGLIVAKNAIGPVRVAHDVRGGGAELSGSIDSDGTLASVFVGGSLLGGSGLTSGAIRSNGNLGSVRVVGDVQGGAGIDSGAILTTVGEIGNITVGGSLLGGAQAGSGSIFSSFRTGVVKIGGDVVGGAGTNSGRIDSTSFMVSVTVGGSVGGSSGVGSGAIVAAEELGAVKIGRDLRGGTGADSGRVVSLTADVASVSIGGSLLGGAATRTGYVGSVGDMGAVRIGGDVVGGHMDDNDPTLDRTGFIEADRIASVTIGGSMIAGINTNLFAELTHNASIRVADDLGPVVVKGSLIGRKTQSSYTPVIISARGQEALAPGATSDVAIRSLTVGGRVEWSLVLAGFDQDDPITAGTNGNASIGPVSVGGDWIASSISAGVQDPNNSGFGKATDVVIPGATLISRIASIAIAGTVAGDVRPEDHFGFVARRIGSFKAGLFLAPLTAATDAPIELSLFTADTTVREL
jgi:hypothetical protein